MIHTCQLLLPSGASYAHHVDFCYEFFVCFNNCINHCSSSCFFLFLFCVWRQSPESSYLVNCLYIWGWGPGKLNFMDCGLKWMMSPDSYFMEKLSLLGNNSVACFSKRINIFAFLVICNGGNYTFNKNLKI